MAEERVQRRLAAILAADVVGYSRLMEADEEGTRARLRNLHAELIDPRVAADGGRIVKTTGDGVLIEFPSAVDAIRNALAIQAGVACRDTDLPENQRLLFRVGVNLGDVIIEGDDIHGDGVNIAARLEALCQPGSVYVSASVHEQVAGKVEAAFEDLGEYSIKNIARPIRVYEARAASPESAGAALSDPLVLPERPSIAVLPFQNMSGDPEQEYFADGITEDIITALSRVRWFFVIARNSSFSYKGTSPDVRQVARDLGVRYVLEGSVRKSGNRVRVTAQLIDGSNGNHVWANRFDRDLEDIFAVQDELTETIVGAIEPELGKVERDRAKAKRPENLDAWDLCHQALWHTYRRTKEDLAQAQILFERARRLDPKMAVAYSGAAEASFFQLVDGHIANRDAYVNEAIRLGRQAVDLDSQDAVARFALGRVLMFARRHPDAVPEFEKAIELDPSLARAHFALGMSLGTSGRPREAIPHIERALRLSPYDPYIGQFMAHIGEAHLFMGAYNKAEKWARDSLRQSNIQWSRWVLLISSLGLQGKEEEAGPAIESLRLAWPHITVSYVESYWPIYDPASMALLLDGLRKAGLPE